MEGDPGQEAAADAAAKRKAAGYLGQVLGGRYRIESVLALGGMGAVFRAFHVHMRKHVALKLLHPSTENLPDLVARFERESVVNAHLTHPNVCSALDFGQFEDGSHYLVLDYIEGRTLRDVMKEGPIPPARAAEIARQLAEALGAAHELAIVHRDVKPSNVMLVDGDRVHVKVVDFGLARLPSKLLQSKDDIRVTRSGTVFGTVAYMAPELARGMHHVDHRSDLYALGIILYEMLAGAHPFDATEASELFRQHRYQPVPSFAERAPGLDVAPKLEAIARRLLEKNPDDRFQSADELLDALDDVYPCEAPPPSHRGPSSRSSSPRSRRRSDVPDPADASPPPAPAADRLPDRTAPRSRVMPILLVAATALLLGVGGFRQLEPDAWDKLGLEPPRSEAARARVAAAMAALPSAAADAPAVTASASSSVPDADAQKPAATLSPEAMRLRAVMQEASGEHDAKRGAKALLDLAKVAPDAFRAYDVVVSAAAIAVSVETGDRSMADDVFGLFSGDALGPAGPDVLFHVVCFSGGSRAATRAADLLAHADVIARASPALRVVRELRNAPCKDRPALYDRAVTEGDERALTLLSSMRGTECLNAPGACCAPSDLKLADAIAKMRERLHK